MGRTKITEIEDSEKEETIYPEHPLFPIEEDEKSFEVTFIQVTRFESGVQKFGPTISADEIKTEEEIMQRWGGGQYIIIARALSKTGYPGRFTKHRRINLPGNPKPLSPDPTPEEQRIANPKTVAETPANPMADNTGFLGMIMQMNQLAMERERQASERATQQNNQFMQMFLAVMQGSKSDAQTMTQMMLQMSAQNQQSMMQMIGAVLANRGGGPEEMAKYAELLRTITGNKSPAGSEESSSDIGRMLENAADLVQGMVALKGSAPPGQVPQQIDPNMQPTGGAASLLKGMLR